MRTENDIKTDMLLQIYRFASSIEPYLASAKSEIPDYLLDECGALIGQLNVMIIARTNTEDENRRKVIEAERKRDELIKALEEIKKKIHGYTDKHICEIATKAIAKAKGEK